MTIDTNMTVKEFKESFKPTYASGTTVYFLQGSGVSKSIVKNSCLALDPNTNKEAFGTAQMYEAVSVAGVAVRVKVESLFGTIEDLFDHLRNTCAEL